MTVSFAAPRWEPASRRHRATPRVRRRAREHGVDLEDVTGSGPGGRITQSDVDRHLAAPPPEPAVPPSVARTVSASPSTVGACVEIDLGTPDRVSHDDVVTLVAAAVVASAPGGVRDPATSLTLVIEGTASHAGSGTVVVMAAEQVLVAWPSLGEGELVRVCVGAVVDRAVVVVDGAERRLAFHQVCTVTLTHDPDRLAPVDAWRWLDAVRAGVERSVGGAGISR